MVITPEQIRAARALLRMAQDDLARRAHVPVDSIRGLEDSSSVSAAPAEVLTVVRQALEEAGVEFIHRGVRTRPELRPDYAERLARIQEISRRSAERLRGHELLTDDDLYDENGLPH
jgi:hypothetical protein